MGSRSDWRARDAERAFEREGRTGQSHDLLTDKRMNVEGGESIFIRGVAAEIAHAAWLDMRRARIRLARAAGCTHSLHPARRHSRDRAARSAHASRLTAVARASNLRVMSFLLPQTREATVIQVREVSLHGDRYLDLVLQVDEPGSAPLSVRLGAAECPADLAEGDKVQARLLMGVVVKIERS